MADHVFETASSETLYTGKIFALRSDRVRMPGGAIAVREVVEHYGAVAIAALDAENNLPLIYQYRHAFGRRLWELPAGLLDIAGEPPQQTAARELQEEAGLRAETWQVLADLNSAPGFSDESVRIYLATGLSEVDRPEAHHEEADMTMRWFPVADAARMVFSGEVVNSIAIAGILAAHAVTEGFARPRPADSPWIDRPTAFAARKGGRAAQ
ncbi:NUDIX domain-containing protein [Mycobacterium mantenii]|uniref:ADP-ribose pyrophosphatase n=1 Tax=Mycobacterium mantenii TaxID=560555 RepID=A0A1A2TQZ4_MYCNT|nr:NUDIX hydrolase [Mycobacterium mantenii]OBH46112.1 ADP-ribose pyrophosphatase [Mycobacterium mantenii]OBH78811.1 ADP-ribose pyrophosphatase [Mycobacterium mantenii]